MNDKTSVLIVYLDITVHLVMHMLTDSVQLGTTVQTRLGTPMLTHALLGLTLKNKEHKAN